MRERILEVTYNELNEMVNESINSILQERHVIKIPHQEPPMPPMPQVPPQMPQDPSMGMEDPSMGGDPSMEGENENSDKDKLRSEVGDVAHLLQADDIEAEDAKSALNTIIQQAKKKMDGSDLKSSADKLTSVDDASNNSDGSGEPNNGEEEQQPQAQQPPMESRKYLKRIVNEMFNDLGGKEEKERQQDRKNQKKNTSGLGKKSPFVSHFA